METKLQRRPYIAQEVVVEKKSNDDECCIAFITILLYLIALAIFISGIISVVYMYQLPVGCSSGLLSSVGIWAAIPFFIAGTFACCMSGQFFTTEDEIDNSNIFMICAAVSAFIFVPAVLFCNIFELYVFTYTTSDSCPSYAAVKIVTSVLAGIEFVVLLVTFVYAIGRNRNKRDMKSEDNDFWGG